MRKHFFLYALLLMLFIFTTPLCAANNPFRDVGGSDWFYDEVLYAYDLGFFSGTSSNTFEPQAGMTRAMFVTVLGRMVAVEESQYTTSSFVDVATGKWYSPYVEWASKSGIVNGTGAGGFSPDAKINREQMATIIARYVQQKDISLPNDSNAVAGFKDADKVASFAKGGLELMRRTGIIKGDANNNFNPQATATRSEAATIFMRLDQAAGGMCAKMYKTGMYRVGIDMPAGEYLISTPDQDLYYLAVSSDSSGSLSSIITNELYFNRIYITVSNGQYFEFEGIAREASKCPAYEVVYDKYPEGMYRVGIDIPQGEYKLSVMDLDDGWGYVEICKDSLNLLDSIIANDNFSSDIYQTITNGQYIKMSGAEIRL